MPLPPPPRPSRRTPRARTSRLGLTAAASACRLPRSLDGALNEAVPTAGWLQIMVLICMQEAGTGFASKPQTDDAEAGDIALDEDETPVVCVRVCLSLEAEARVARRGKKIVTSPGQTAAPL